MSDSIHDLNDVNILDKIRCADGIDRLKAFFKSTLKNGRDKAVSLLNDEKLQFSTLFALRREIEESGLHKHLNPRNKSALQITAKILARKPSNIRSLPQDSRQATHSALKWILKTGCINDGMDKSHDEVIDIAALHIIKSYKDKTVLPVIVNLLFDRHCKGAFTYDLIWTCFESGDPHVLYLIAHRLLSPRQKDYELAARLLKFIPCMDRSSSRDRLQQYSCCIRWLNENYPFLYYTGESLHQSCSPIPFAVSLEAKYLCKAVIADSGKLAVPLSEDEHRLLGTFNSLDNYTKTLLSNCSSLLYRRNYYWWHKWLHSPIQEQIAYAVKMGGWTP